MGIDLAKRQEQALYRFFDAGGRLLYIGISLHPFQRMGSHRTDKSWWGEVATVAIERHPTRAQVIEAERYAIQTEKPRYNVVHAAPRRDRVITRFTYWEPRVDTLVTVYDVWPLHPSKLWLFCICGERLRGTFFFERENGEVEIRAKCPCGAKAQRTIPRLRNRVRLIEGI